MRAKKSSLAVRALDNYELEREASPPMLDTRTLWAASVKKKCAKKKRKAKRRKHGIFTRAK